MFFVAIILALHIESNAPTIVAHKKTLDDCERAVLILNAKPEINTDEAKAAGATAVCLIVHEPSY